MAINTNAIYSVFSFIAFLLSFVPLYWHIEAWNVGTCMYMIWTGIACLTYFINSIVWNGNAINWAPVWCDISTRITIAIPVAIPAASLCINRRLYHIASPTTVTKTQREKRRGVIVDLLICIGIPVFQMLLQYIVEGHRFDIFEDFGCFPATYNTLPAYFLVWSWPIAIGMVSATYCTLTLVAFTKRRRQLKDLLSVNNNLTYSRYLRLMALAGTEVLFTVPLSSYVIYLNVKETVQPWVSWDFVHSGYSRVSQIPRVQYSQFPQLVVSLELSRWLLVLCAFTFFAFFGFADEAKKHYRLAVTSVAKRVGYDIVFDGTQCSSPTSFSGKGLKGGLNLSLPVYSSKSKEANRGSMSSFSDKLSTSIYISDFSVTDDLRVQPYSPGGTSSSSELYTPIEDAALCVPEPSWDSTSVRRPSVPDAPKSVGPESVIDVV